MPDLRVVIGEREYEVACREGEEPYLQAAARMLDTEAEALAQQIGRLPEIRMLLMSGLMLADRTAGLEEQLRIAQQDLENARAEIESLHSVGPIPRESDDPSVPPSVLESLAELTERAEAVAQTLVERKAR